MEIQEAQNGEEAASEVPPPPFDGVMPQLELYERQDDSVEADEERINDAKLLQYYSSASKVQVLQRNKIYLCPTMSKKRRIMLPLPTEDQETSRMHT